MSEHLVKLQARTRLSRALLAVHCQAHSETTPFCKFTKMSSSEKKWKSVKFWQNYCHEFVAPFLANPVQPSLWQSSPVTRSSITRDLDVGDPSLPGLYHVRSHFQDHRRVRVFHCAPPDALQHVHSTYTELKWTDVNWILTWTSRPSYTTCADWSRASASRLYYAVIGCSETRTVSARLILSTCFPMRLFTLEFSNWSLVQLVCCE